MGTTLIVVGVLWALLGVGNVLILAGASDPDAPALVRAVAERKLAFALIFNGILFVLPGLGLAGLGAVIRGRSAAPAPAARDQTRKCPFCAESIQAEATLCRFCGRAMPSSM